MFQEENCALRPWRLC